MTVSSPMTLLVRIARPLLLVATMAPWGLAAMGDTADELDGSQLVKFAEFCAETDGVEPEGRGALAHGFAPVESIADFLRSARPRLCPSRRSEQGNGRIRRSRAKGYSRMSP